MLKLGNFVKCILSCYPVYYKSVFTSESSPPPTTKFLPPSLSKQKHEGWHEKSVNIDMHLDGHLQGYHCNKREFSQ